MISFAKLLVDLGLKQYSENEERLEKPTTVAIVLLVGLFAATSLVVLATDTLLGDDYRKSHDWPYAVVFMLAGGFALWRFSRLRATESVASESQQQSKTGYQLLDVSLRGWGKGLLVLSVLFLWSESTLISGPRSADFAGKWSYEWSHSLGPWKDSWANKLDGGTTVESSGSITFDGNPGRYEDSGKVSVEGVMSEVLKFSRTDSGQWSWDRSEHVIRLVADESQVTPIDEFTRRAIDGPGPGKRIRDLLSSTSPSDLRVLKISGRDLHIDVEGQSVRYERVE